MESPSLDIPNPPGCIPLSPAPGDPSLAGGLDWVIPRGPSQPQPFCESLEGSEMFSALFLCPVSEQSTPRMEQSSDQNNSRKRHSFKTTLADRGEQQHHHICPCQPLSKHVGWFNPTTLLKHFPLPCWAWQHFCSSRQTIPSGKPGPSRGVTAPEPAQGWAVASLQWHKQPAAASWDGPAQESRHWATHQKTTFYCSLPPASLLLFISTTHLYLYNTFHCHFPHLYLRHPGLYLHYLFLFCCTE